MGELPQRIRAEAEEDEAETNEAAEPVGEAQIAGTEPTISGMPEKMLSEPGRPDALDLLVEDLEANPEPEEE